MVSAIADALRELHRRLTVEPKPRAVITPRGVVIELAEYKPSAEIWALGRSYISVGLGKRKAIKTFEILAEMYGNVSPNRAYMAADTYLGKVHGWGTDEYYKARSDIDAFARDVPGLIEEYGDEYRRLAWRVEWLSRLWRSARRENGRRILIDSPQVRVYVSEENPEYITVDTGERVILECKPNLRGVDLIAKAAEKGKPELVRRMMHKPRYYCQTFNLIDRETGEVVG